jgi:hypothetical protein
MARPTKQTPEIIEAAKAYLDNYEGAGDAIPSIAGLAVALKVSRSTLYLWAEDKDSEFSDISSELFAKQEQTLLSKGLTGDFNSTITKLILTKHNYSDKQELSGADGGPVQVDAKVEVEFV